jgi:hypothetical protein
MQIHRYDSIRKTTMQHKNFRGLVVSSVSGLLLVAAGTASAVELEVGDTKASLYGYAKLDIIYDVDADLGNAVGHSKIRLDDVNGPEGHTTLHALQSRLGVKTATPTSHGTVTTVIEGDFFAGGNFRLRHAYGEWNGILGGQTWTNFGNFLGYTPTIDFIGQPGQTFISRQAQLRYTTGGLSMALEAPGTAGGRTAIPAKTVEDVVADNEDTASKNGLPDLTLQYKGSVGSLSYATSAVIRQVGVYDAGTDSDETAFGYGLSLSAKFPLVAGISVQSSVVYGDGIGGYLYVNPGAPAYYDNDTGDVETIEALGGTLGLTMKAGAGNINLAYGVATADWDDAEAEGLAVAGNDEKFQSIFVNYIWSPVSNVEYGIEAGHHSRETVSGADGDAVRIQAMAKYSF